MKVTKNKYYYPIARRNITRISYDESPAHRGKWKHAIDFIVPENVPIRASLDGVVFDVKDDSNTGGESKSFDEFGNYIEILHAHGEYTIYEHIRKNGSRVKRGNRVRARQIIGYSGKTGWIAHLGPHLHFDVHTYFGKGKNDYASIRVRWKSKNGLKQQK
jgi:murein DD-endopeptidase MepM/ murein hydrolase activator NlpD